MSRLFSRTAKNDWLKICIKRQASRLLKINIYLQGKSSAVTATQLCRARAERATRARPTATTIAGPRKKHVLVNVVYVYYDKMLITFNYKDGDKRRPFEEARKALSKSANPVQHGAEQGSSTFYWCYPTRIKTNQNTKIPTTSQVAGTSNATPRCLTRKGIEPLSPP